MSIDINEFIANAFWTDYCAEIEARKETAGSHVKILTIFLEWLDQRVEDGPVIDLRLVKNQAARVAANRIVGGNKNEKKTQG